MAAKNPTHFQLDLKSAIGFLANENLDSFLLKFRLSAFCVVSQVVFSHEPPVGIVSETTEKLLHHYLGRMVPPNTELRYGSNLLKYGASRKVALLGDDLCLLSTQLSLFMQHARVQWTSFKSLVPALGLLSSLEPVISSLLCDLVRFSARNPSFDYGRSLEAMVGPLLSVSQRRELTSKVDIRVSPEYPWSFQYYRSVVAEAAGINTSENIEWLQLGRGTVSQNKLLCTTSHLGDLYSTAYVRANLSLCIYVDDLTPSHLLTFGENSVVQARSESIESTSHERPVPKGLADLLRSIGPDAVQQHMKEVMRELSGAAVKTKLKGSIDRSLRFPDPVFQAQKPAMPVKTPEYYLLDLKAAIEFLLKEDLDSFMPKLKFAMFCMVSKLVFNQEPPADVVSETTLKLLHCHMTSWGGAASALDPGLVRAAATAGFDENASVTVGRTCFLLGSSLAETPVFSVERFFSSLLNDLVSFYSNNPDFDFGLHLDSMVGPLLPASQRRRLTSEIDLRIPPQYPWSYQSQGSLAALLLQARSGFPPSLPQEYLELGRATKSQRIMLTAIVNISDAYSVARLRHMFAAAILVDGDSPELTSSEKCFMLDTTVFFFCPWQKKFGRGKKFF